MIQSVLIQSAVQHHTYMGWNTHTTFGNVQSYICTCLYRRLKSLNPDTAWDGRMESRVWDAGAAYVIHSLFKPPVKTWRNNNACDH